jgi:NADH-quinone oxidoreductase subunit L
VFVTSLYTFRMLFMTFHGRERFREPQHGHAGSAHEQKHDQEKKHEAPADAHGTHAVAHDSHGVAANPAHKDDHGHGHHAVEPRESPWVVTLPLILLAIPSLVIGYFTVGRVLFGGYFDGSIYVEQAHDVVAEIGREFPGALPFAVQGLMSLPFALAVAGFLTAWVFCLWRPSWATGLGRALGWLRTVLVNKYYFDWFNEHVVAALARFIGMGLWKVGDETVIDGALVNGSATEVSRFGSLVRRAQSGYLYSYAFWMMIGLAVLLGWFLLRA